MQHEVKQLMNNEDDGQEADLEFIKVEWMREEEERERGSLTPCVGSIKVMRSMHGS